MSEAHFLFIINFINVNANKPLNDEFVQHYRQYGSFISSMNVNEFDITLNLRLGIENHRNS